MIKAKIKADGIHASLIAALALFDHLLGDRVHVQVLAGKISADEWDALEKSGGSLDEVNAARKKIDLHPQDPKRNFRLVKKAFEKSLRSGNGVLVVITDGANRFKVSDPSFKETFTFIAEQHHGVKASVTESTDSFDTVFFEYVEPKGAIAEGTQKALNNQKDQVDVANGKKDEKTV